MHSTFIDFNNKHYHPFFKFYVKNATGDMIDQSKHTKPYFYFTDEEIADIYSGGKVTLTIGVVLTNSYEAGRFSGSSFVNPLHKCALSSWVESSLLDTLGEIYHESSFFEIDMLDYRDFIPDMIAHKISFFMQHYEVEQSNSPLLKRVSSYPRTKFAKKYDTHRYIMRAIKMNNESDDDINLEDNISVVFDLPRHFEITNDFDTNDLHIAKLPLNINLEADEESNPKLHHFVIEKVDSVEISGFIKDPLFDNKYQASYYCQSKEYDCKIDDLYLSKEKRYQDEVGVDILGSYTSNIYLYKSGEDAERAMSIAKKKLEAVYNRIQ